MIFVVFCDFFLPIQFYNSKYWKNGVKMSQINVKYINLPISSFQKRFKSKKNWRKCPHPEQLWGGGGGEERDRERNFHQNRSINECAR